MSATGNRGEKPSLRRFEDVYEEATWIVKKIQSLCATGSTLREIAVLFRTAFASMPLQAELAKNGIRFKLFGGRKFYETAHVRDVISYEACRHRLMNCLASCHAVASRIGARTV